MRNKLSDPRFYLKAVVGLAGLGLIVLPLGSDALGALIGPGHAGGCRVVSVTDGDTVRLHCPGRGLEKTRLLGFDTPEVFSPQCASEFLRGIRATWALRALLFRADKMGVVREGTDKYGRALVFMSLDGVPLARRMIEAGHARAYDGGRRGGWCLGAMP